MTAPLTLTVNQVARFLQVTPRTVRQAIEHGEVPAKKIGRVWRIPASFVTEYLGDNDHEAATVIAELVSTTPAWGQ